MLAELWVVQRIFQGHPQLFTGTLHKMYNYLSRSDANCRYVYMTHAYIELTWLCPNVIAYFKSPWPRARSEAEPAEDEV